MHAPFADAAFAVFNRGLALRDRHQDGEPIIWDSEQEALQQLLAA